MFHGAIIRLVYRVLAPGHPRGHVDVHAVRETSTAETLWIHTHGMSRWGHKDVELVCVPDELRGYAHGVLFEVIGYMHGHRPIHPDEHFAGALVSERQAILHRGTARLVPRDDDPPHDEMLRIVDYQQPAESGFPRRLLATHVCSLAEQTRSALKREAMYRQALAIFPGGEDDPDDDLHANPNNWAAWEGLGSALFDQGRETEGTACLKHAVAASRAWARNYAGFVREQVESGAVPRDDSDPRYRFWSAIRLE